MKRSTIAKTFAIAALAALSLSIAPAAKAADKGCSNASLNGTFVLKATGYHIEPTTVLQIALVFAETFDGNGGLTGTGLQSASGNISQVTLTGTYTVNPDCSGTYTAQILAGHPFTVHFFFVIDDNENEFQGIATDPNTGITGTARRQFPMGDWRQ